MLALGTDEAAVSELGAMEGDTWDGCESTRGNFRPHHRPVGDFGQNCSLLRRAQSGEATVEGALSVLWEVSVSQFWLHRGKLLVGLILLWNTRDSQCAVLTVVGPCTKGYFIHTGY